MIIFLRNTLNLLTKESSDPRKLTQHKATKLNLLYSIRYSDIIVLDNIVRERKRKMGNRPIIVISRQTTTMLGDNQSNRNQEILATGKVSQGMSALQRLQLCCCIAIMQMLPTLTKRVFPLMQVITSLRSGSQVDGRISTYTGGDVNLTTEFRCKIFHSPE